MLFPFLRRVVALHAIQLSSGSAELGRHHLRAQNLFFAAVHDHHHKHLYGDRLNGDGAYLVEAGQAIKATGRLTALRQLVTSFCSLVNGPFAESWLQQRRQEDSRQQAQ